MTDNDNATSTEPENATGQNNGGGQTIPDGYIPQEEVNALVGRTRKEARQKAIESLLGELGVDNADQLKAVFTDYQQRREAEMSAEQKALERANRLEQELQEARAKAERAERERETDRRNRVIADALKSAGAQHPSDLLLIASNIGVSFDDVFNDNGDADDKLLQNRIGELRKERPAAFGASGPGSPSNAGGRPPNPDRVVEEVQKQIQKRYGLL